MQGTTSSTTRSLFKILVLPHLFSLTSRSLKSRPKIHSFEGLGTLGVANPIPDPTTAAFSRGGLRKTSTIPGNENRLGEPSAGKLLGRPNLPLPGIDISIRQAPLLACFCCTPQRPKSRKCDLRRQHGRATQRAHLIGRHTQLMRRPRNPQQTPRWECCSPNHPNGAQGAAIPANKTLLPRTDGHDSRHRPALQPLTPRRHAPLNP